MAGIIVKVWPVGGFNTSSSKQVGDSIDYITNSEKTELSIDEVGEKVASRHLRSEVRYVADAVKTCEGALVGTQNLVSVETAFSEKSLYIKFK